MGWPSPAIGRVSQNNTLPATLFGQSGDYSNRVTQQLVWEL